MKTYTVLLLFQFRVDLGDGKSNIMRLCEERMIILKARNAESALSKAKQYGHKAQFSSENPDPTWHFEFIGVKDLLLQDFLDAEEVWYDIKTHKMPMERKEHLLPAEDKLNAIMHERAGKMRKKSRK